MHGALGAPRRLRSIYLDQQDWETETVEMNSVNIVQVNAVVAEYYGGPSVGSVALNAELRRLGAFATLYSTGLNGSAGTVIDQDELQRLTSSGASLVIHRPAWPWFMQNGRGMLTSIFKAARTSDLIHIHGQYHLPHIYAYLAARWFGVPYGIQPHGALEPYQRAKSKYRKKLYNFIIGGRILRQASYVHFASLSEAERAEDVVRVNQRIVIPLGASLPPEQPIRALTSELERRRRGEVVLFLGRLTKKKRPDLLLSAWAGAKRPAGALLIVAGPDADVTRRELRQQAERLGISDSVVFSGQVTGPEKAWLYRRCGTFVLASENENFGLTVVEAMLGGCHVIASTQVASSKFLVESSSGSVLSSMTSESLATAVSHALANEALIVDSGRRASLFALERLNWKPLASALLERARKVPRP